MSRIVVQALFLSMLGGRLAGQQLPQNFTRWEPEQIPPSVARLHPDDYRYEGLIFGGVALGVLGVWVGSQLADPCPLDAGGSCRTDRVGNAVALGLTGAVVGGGLGYLIGRLSPKRPAPLMVSPEPPRLPAVVPDSVRQRAGYQHWRGALIGTAAGAVLGGVLAVVADAGCADCTTTTGERVKVAVAVTGVGSMVGFLAGLASPRYVWVPRGGAGEVGSDPNRE